MKKFIGVICLFFLLTCSVGAQGLTSADVVTSLTQRLHSDNVLFPDSVKQQFANFGARVATVHGFAYSRTDTVLLMPDSMRYALSEIAVWVYRVGRLGAAQPSWKHVDLGDFGKAGMIEPTSSAFWDFTNEMGSVDSQFTAGGETSWVYVFPFPVAADSLDTLLVHYFAWADTINGNISTIYHDPIVECALIPAYIRMGRSDKAVEAWNKASSQLSKLRNDKLMEVFDIEIVPRKLGGRE